MKSYVLLYFISVIGLLLIVLIADMTTIFKNYYISLEKDGYRTKREYLKDGNTYQFIFDRKLKDYKVECICIFTPLLNTGVLGNYLWFGILISPLLLTSLIKDRHQYNKKYYCTNCEVYTRYGYIKLYNKENHLPYEDKCCPICEEKNKMLEHNRIGKLKNFPKIKEAHFALYFNDFNKETITISELKNEVIKTYVNKIKEALNKRKQIWNERKQKSLEKKLETIKRKQNKALSFHEQQNLIIKQHNKSIQ